MKKRLFPKIKKEIKDFLLSEEGKISKEKVAKLGIAASVLAMMFQSDNVSAGHSSSVPHSSGAQPHQNVFFSERRGGHNSGIPHASHPNHASHGSHGSHSSHSSHGQW